MIVLGRCSWICLAKWELLSTAFNCPDLIFVTINPWSSISMTINQGLADSFGWWFLFWWLFFMKQILEMSHFHWSNSAFCIKISRKKWSIWIFTSPWPIWIPYDSDETHSHPLMKRAIRAKVNLVRREIPKLVRCTLEALIVTWESNRCPLTSPIWFASCKEKTPE